MKKLFSLVVALVVCVGAAMADPGINKVETVSHNYTIKVYAPEGFEPSYLGLGEWSSNCIGMIPNIDEAGNLYYYAKFKAPEGSEFKFVAEKDRENSIKRFDQKNKCWMEVNSIVLGNDSVAVFHYSDAAQYMWSSVVDGIEAMETELRANQKPVAVSRPSYYVMKYGRPYDLSGREIK